LNSRFHDVAIIGAGPAGLTAAYLLAKGGASVVTLESDPQYVGGISRTVNYKGFRFDIGGHRFFSKAREVEDLWTEILPNDMLERPRSSRIYYRGKFYAYPLKASEALMKLGPVECVRCLASYGRAKLFPVANPRSFEDWVSNEFGSRLFSIFFKTYTEKVWGMSCKEISADWAAQRIKGLSLGTAIKNALVRSKPKDRSDVIKTLIDSFRYPRHGPGMMWEACAAKIREMGGSILMGARAVECARLGGDRGEPLWSITCAVVGGERVQIRAKHVISSAPMREVVNSLRPAPDRRTIAAANRLRYRDFLTVVLILRERRAFTDNWIYIHDPNVKVGRVQNYKSWSPEMVPDSAYCCYGLEYFCFEGDGLWTSTDDDLIELAKLETEKIGLATRTDVVDGCVVRQPKAYPVYDDEYAENVQTIREALEADYPNLYLVGRNGMHKYNNQDHAMMTAMLTARNILADARLYDPWKVNQDAEYHETGEAGAQAIWTGLRAVPTPISSAQRSAAP
jgi:protoporphyrinogen oxidase